MKKFMTLVSLLFKQQFRAKAATVSNGKKGKGGTIALIVLLVVAFLPMLVGAALLVYAIGTITMGDQGTVAFLALVCQALVLLLGISSLIVGVFMPRDADKLMYLPIKPSTIFTAKLTVAYVNELITTAVTILFIFIPYGIGASMGVAYYLMLIPALFLIPLLPILVGTIVAMPISLLLNKLGKNGIGKTFVSILAFVMFMAVYFVFFTGITNLEASMPEDSVDDLSVIALMLKDMLAGISSKMIYVHTNYVLAGSLVATKFGSWILNFFLTIIEFAVLGCLTLLIAKPFYKYMLSNHVEGGGSKSKAKLTYETKPTSIIRQLVTTDFKRTLRDSQMGFQAFAGLIIMPLIVVVFGFGFTGSAGEEAIDVSNAVYQLIAPIGLVAYLILLGASSNVLGLYPISRENKSFYILKSLPISFNKILTAKVIVSTLVMAVVYLLTAIAAVIFLKIQWYYGIAMMIVLCFTGFGAQCITTKIDLKSPKFGWSNFNQSLKNSKNAFIAMLIGFLIMLVIGGISAVFIILYMAIEQTIIIPLMWVVLAIVSGLFAFICYKIMISSSQKLFERIEA